MSILTHRAITGSCCPHADPHLPGLPQPATRCLAPDGEGLWCSRSADHLGDHIAFTADCLLATWPQHVTMTTLALWRCPDVGLWVSPLIDLVVGRDPGRFERIVLADITDLPGDLGCPHEQAAWAVRYLPEQLYRATLDPDLIVP